MTREQFAILVLRANGVWSVPSYGGSYSYIDISASFAKNWIQYLASARGILDFCPDFGDTSHYCPGAALTRERLAHILALVFNLPLADTSDEALAAAPDPRPAGNFVPVSYHLPGMPLAASHQQVISQTIMYTYDPLYRLTAADYSTGDYYHYTYDAVGNRLTQEKSVSGQQSTDGYQYDIANRLINVNGVDYTWDNNGNLLNDGVNSYSYDAANRLTAVSSQQSAFSYGYNGLGDRLQRTINNQPVNYTLDLNTGLPNVLADNSDTYTYGLGHIGQTGTTGTSYFLGDALDSTRQLTDAAGQISLAQSYDPYGDLVMQAGNSTSIFGYTGQQTDPSGLVYLRARYYAPMQARFLSRDTWEGNPYQPMSYNLWAYANANPVVYTDPSGQWCIAGFSFGPGRGCTEDEQERWVNFYMNSALIWSKLHGSDSDSSKYIRGFFFEYLDTIAILPFMTAEAAVLDALGGCGWNTANYYKGALYTIGTDQKVIAGRYAARFFLMVQAAAEAGIGIAGLGGGITVSGTGVGAIGGVPVATLSAVLVGHGAAVLGALAVREVAMPLPPLHFAASGGGGGSHMFGADGTQFTAKDYWTSRDGSVHLDAENPAPGRRPGDLHVQEEPSGQKYHYNPETKWFDGLPKYIEKQIIDDPNFLRALKNALRALGEW